MNLTATRVWVSIALSAVSIALVFGIAQQKIAQRTESLLVTAAPVSTSAAVEEPEALKRKLGVPLWLNDADLKAAIEALTSLDACRDLDIVVTDPGEAGRTVTLRIGPDKTVREALEILASVYNREFSVSKGVVHLKKRGLLVEKPRRLVAPDAGIRDDLRARYRDDLEKLDADADRRIADLLRETAKRLHESAVQRSGEGKDWSMFADQLKKSAEQLSKLADELERKTKAGEKPRVRQFLWREDLTPEKKERMEEWLRKRGYLDREERPEWRRYWPEVWSDKLFPQIRDLLKDWPRTEFSYRAGDLKGLLDSITPEQWKLHERQGHLKLRDLTPRQREMLGVKAGEGSRISMTFVIGDKKLTIQSE